MGFIIIFENKKLLETGTFNWSCISNLNSSSSFIIIVISHIAEKAGFGTAGELAIRKMMSELNPRIVFINSRIKRSKRLQNSGKS